MWMSAAGSVASFRLSLSSKLLFLFVSTIVFFEPHSLHVSAVDYKSSAIVHQTQVALAQILSTEKEKLTKSNNCPYFTIPAIFEKIHKNANSAQSAIVQSSMITTPCLDSHSFGNSLSDYIESRICSNITGYHYVAVSSAAPSRTNPFNILPEIIYNPGFANKKSFEELKAICRCTTICHEHEFALWHSRAPMVRDILRPVFDKHFLAMTEEKLQIEESIAATSWRSVVRAPVTETSAGHRNQGVEAASTLPMIPDVAIHYRCGDNTVGHYGYLAFPAFKRRIPRNATSIYVMAESSSRNANAQRISQCNAILSGLFEYLQNEFQTASIVVLRGANMYDDMTRLALAKTTICSVSSFCIWPALASTTMAYYPITRLIAKATAPEYDSSRHFQWLDVFPEEAVLPGVKAKRMDNAQILKFLHKPKGFRPVPPQYVLDKQRGKGRRAGDNKR